MRTHREPIERVQPGTKFISKYGTVWEIVNISRSDKVFVGELRMKSGTFLKFAYPAGTYLRIADSNVDGV